MFGDWMSEETKIKIFYNFVRLKPVNNENKINANINGKIKYFKILGATSTTKEIAGNLLTKPEMGTRISISGKKKYSKILIQLQ